ncbi:MAG: hypothetical protein BGN96_03120 [Bacteroidales bacterium 45-6]|uniref:hypothetical protein n=1 Tax=uncultured Dysgonomonas sp. TaxID=206096 RepID=UPI00095C0879|nr:hypothetical protein [uncultured Dysgonomonas sp.]OJU38617.1 MAG: hypothetical protein BGN96_03120 [Bacteroidales bacterium 45-6]
MENRIITIENGIVAIPHRVSMGIAEIADLFGVFYQTAKREIHSIEKSGIADGDYSQSCTCNGSKVPPDYYGLEMVISVAFRVQSAKAKLFRKWLIRRISASAHPIVEQLAGKIQLTDKFLWN